MSYPVPLEDQKKKIFELLRDTSVGRIIIFGEAGVGKTWMARVVSESAILQGLYDATLWIIPEHLKEGRSLAEIVSLQLSAYPLTSVEREDVDQKKQKEELEIMKKLILKKLDEMGSAKMKKMTAPRLNDVISGKPGYKGEVKADLTDATLKKPYLLVVLDDILENDEDEICRELDILLPMEHGNFKVLVTRRGRDSDDGLHKKNDGIRSVIKDKNQFEMKFLSDNEASNLLKDTVKSEVFNARDFGRLANAIVKNSSGHPGAIVMVAKGLNRLKDSELKTSIEEATSSIESTEISPKVNLTRLVKFVYGMLQSTTISNCAWYCRYLFQQRGGMHFNELITYWLMEGYFKHHDHIEEAYREAHTILMELLDRGILRAKVDNYVSMESDAMEIIDFRRDGLSGSACLGLPSVLHGANWECIGSVSQTRGMIKGCHLRSNKISRLLIDGSRLCREVPKNSFEPGKLKALVILNPMFKNLPEIFSEFMELQVLVLRSCTQLEKIDEIRKLTQLIVLEVSGACLLNELHDDLFKEMTSLRSVNLSKTGIQSLPSSLVDRAELRWLILKRCLNLKLKRFQKFPEKLEVIDLSGSATINNLGRRIRDMVNLQTLDISRTKIRRLPFFENVPKLSRLLLSDCPSLKRLPALKELSGLEILDCSNSKNLREFQGESLKAKFLNLSNCSMQKLPSQIINQSHILLSGCHAFVKLPSTKALEDLEVLDLSNASMFINFEDETFDHLKSLRQLNLSKTIIEKLPSLSPLTELRQLLLKDCSHLEDLLGLSTLPKLEVLNLSGCCNLVIRENESFKNMLDLKILNLSRTKVISLPSDCFPKNLCQLIIKDCTDMKDLPSLEFLLDLEVLDLCGLKSLSSKETNCINNMTKLRRLDLSGVVVDEFPSLENLTNLTELLLRGCTCKVSFQKLETFSNLRKLSLGAFADLGNSNLMSLSLLEELDLSEIKREDYPYEIMKLTGLKRLRLQLNKKVTELDWKRIKYIPEYFDLDGCGSPSTEEESIQADCSHYLAPDDFPSLVIFGYGFFEFLEKENNSQLWDKCFQQFHFSVWPPRKEDGIQIDEMAGYLGQSGLLRDIETQSRAPLCKGRYHKDLKRYLEIHGPYDLLSQHKDVLKCADHMSLIGDSSITCISMVGFDTLKSKKSCWFERCEKIHCMIDTKVEPTALEKLENLYLYNLSSLEYICSDDLQPQVFMGLKSLFIECCPKLSKVFHLSQLPENLSTLEIKFCDGMDMLFHPERPVKCNLQNLHLTGLSNLKIIGATLPCLKKLKVRGCPALSSITVPDECEVVVDSRKVQIVRLTN